MTAFRALPTFAGLDVGIFTRGADACRLTSAIMSVRETYPAAYAAAVALGDPASAARRADCLRILGALPAKAQARILAAYQGS